MSRRYSIWLCDNERDFIVASWDDLSDVDVMGVLCNINPGPGISIEVKIKAERDAVIPVTDYAELCGDYSDGVHGVVKSRVHDE